MDAGLVTKSFEPFATAYVTATTSTGSTTFTGQNAAAPHVMFTNEGVNTVYVAFGKTTATAALPTGTPANNCTPIPAGVIITLYKGPQNDTVAYITRTSTSTIDITCGIGS